MNQLAEIGEQFDREIHVIRTEDDLVRLKAAYLGKGGRVTECLKGLGQLPPDQRPTIGAQINQLKQKIEALNQQTHHLTEALLNHAVGEALKGKDLS